MLLTAMAVSKEQKALYNEKARPYKDTLEELKKEASTLKAAARKNPEMEPYFMFRNAIIALKSCNLMVQMSTLSHEIQDLKNDKLVGDARKEVANALNELVKIVGDQIDEGLTENQDRLEKIKDLNPSRRLKLLLAFRETMQNLKIAVGTGKWRWYFPELHMKLTILARNLMDFKEYGAAKDSNAPYYRELQEHMKFLTEEAQTAAQDYRSKYELASQDLADLQSIQKLFEMLKRIFVFTGNKTEQEKIQISLDSNKERIEAIIAEQKGGKKKKK